MNFTCTIAMILDFMNSLVGTLKDNIVTESIKNLLLKFVSNEVSDYQTIFLPVLLLLKLLFILITGLVKSSANSRVLGYFYWIRLPSQYQ